MTETESIEYKQSWRDEYLKWICGFANAQGGRLYIGMDDAGLWVEFPYRMEERSGGTREENRKETRVIAREETGEQIITLIKADSSITMKEMAKRVGISQKGIEWQIQQLKKTGRLQRIGPTKGGHWEIIGGNDD